MGPSVIWVQEASDERQPGMLPSQLPALAGDWEHTHAHQGPGTATLWNAMQLLKEAFHDRLKEKVSIKHSTFCFKNLHFLPCTF